SEPLGQKVLEQLLPGVQRFEDKEVQTASAAYYDMASFTNRVTIGIFLMSGLLAGGLAMLSSRHITRGLGKLKWGADHLGSGQLNEHITLASNDELGE